MGGKRESWRGPRRSSLYCRLGQSLMPARAFTHAVEQAPEKASYWNSLAAVYSYQNRLSLTVKTLEGEQHAIAGSSSFVDWYNLANGLCTMQEFSLAASAYRRTIQLNRGYAPAWNNLGTIEGVAGNTQADCFIDMRRLDGRQ